MGRVRETLHDALRQTDAVLLALCVASTLYGMVLIASATSFRGTLKYVAVQGLGLLIGLALYFFLSSIDVFELAKQWKWLLGFNVGFLLLLLTPFGQTRNGNRAWLGVNDIGKNLGVGFLRNFPVTVQPAVVFVTEPVAEITAMPALCAVTLPSPSTAATAVSLDFQETVSPTTGVAAFTVSLFPS